MRNLQHMNKTLLLVRNIIQQSDASDPIVDALAEVDELMADTLAEYIPGQLR